MMAASELRRPQWWWERELAAPRWVEGCLEFQDYCRHGAGGSVLTGVLGDQMGRAPPHSLSLPCLSFFSCPRWVGRASLAVQGLRLQASNAGSMASIPSPTKTPHALWHGKKNY